MTDLVFLAIQRPPPTPGETAGKTGRKKGTGDGAGFEQVLRQESEREEEEKQPPVTPEGAVLVPPVVTLPTPPPPTVPVLDGQAVPPVDGQADVLPELLVQPGVGAVLANPVPAQPFSGEQPVEAPATPALSQAQSAGKAAGVQGLETSAASVTAAQSEALLSKLAPASGESPAAPPVDLSSQAELPQPPQPVQAVPDLSNETPLSVPAPVGSRREQPIQAPAPQTMDAQVQIEEPRVERTPVEKPEASPAPARSTGSAEAAAAALETGATPVETSPVRANQAANPTAEPARLAEARAAQIIRQIAPHVDGAVRSGQTSLRVQLNPEELGRIDLRLTATSGGLGVTLIADQGATAHMLEEQLDHLRQTLAKAGVQLSSLQVSTGGHSQPQHQPGWQANQQSPRPFLPLNQERDEPAEYSTHKTERTRSISPYGVDYRI